MGDLVFITTMEFVQNRADMRIECECGRIINIPFANVFAMLEASRSTSTAPSEG